MQVIQQSPRIQSLNVLPYLLCLYYNIYIPVRRAMKKIFTTGKGLAGWYTVHSASLVADAGHSLSGTSFAYSSKASSESLVDLQTCWATLLPYSAGDYPVNHPLHDTHTGLPNLRALAPPRFLYS